MAAEAYFESKMNEPAWDDLALMKVKLRTMRVTLSNTYMTICDL